MHHWQAIHEPSAPFVYLYGDGSVELRLHVMGDAPDSIAIVLWDKYRGEKPLFRGYLEPWTPTADGRAFRIRVPVGTRRLSYRFCFQEKGHCGWLGSSGWSQTASGARPFELPYLFDEESHSAPLWTQGAVIYQIFVDRFAREPDDGPEPTQRWGAPPNAHDFQGGNLAGILAHLDYLQRLGVDALYLTPIFLSPSNHRYDTTDYYRIDPRVGDEAALQHLADEAHRRGIRLLLDGVFNHVGTEFAPFQDFISKGETSSYADWFYPLPSQKEEQGAAYATFGFVSQMPKLATERPAVQRYFAEVVSHWMQLAPIDGWRLDVADEVAPSFWQAIRALTAALRPESVLIGEVWNDALRWLGPHAFHGVMNYLFRDATLALAKGEIGPERYVRFLGQVMGRYSLPALTTSWNLLGSHDTMRIATALEENQERFELALALQMTWPGSPMIYYGDEIGLTGGADPACRQAMIWEEDRQDRQRLALYQKWTHLRQAYPALRVGQWRLVNVDPVYELLHFERFTEDQRIQVVLHTGDGTIETPIGGFTPGQRVIDLFSGHSAITNRAGQLQLQLRGYQFALLSLER